MLTVFLQLVSEETILFWIWPYVLWPNMQNLFKGGNYSRTKTIHRNTVWTVTFVLNYWFCSYINMCQCSDFFFFHFFFQYETIVISSPSSFGHSDPDSVNCSPYYLCTYNHFGQNVFNIIEKSGEILKEWQTSGASRSPDLNFMVSESKKLLTSGRQDSRKLLLHSIY